MSEPTPRPVPEGIAAKLRELINELEATSASGEAAAGHGEINFKLDNRNMMWEVSYKTNAAF